MPPRHKAGECIHPDNVPCAKARSYLKKEGRLCEVGAPRKRDKPQDGRSFLERFLEEWLG